MDQVEEFAMSQPANFTEGCARQLTQVVQAPRITLAMYAKEMEESPAMWLPLFTLKLKHSL